ARLPSTPAIPTRSTTTPASRRRSGTATRRRRATTWVPSAGRGPAGGYSEERSNALGGADGQLDLRSAPVVRHRAGAGDAHRRRTRGTVKTAPAASGESQD